MSQESGIENKKTKLCKYECKWPYTHIAKQIDYCCIGCNKSGIGSNEHDPSENSCNDNALCCCPCALVLDILCFIPMCLGYYNLTNPNN